MPGISVRAIKRAAVLASSAEGGRTERWVGRA